MINKKLFLIIGLLFMLQIGCKKEDVVVAESSNNLINKYSQLIEKYRGINNDDLWEIYQNITKIPSIVNNLKFDYMLLKKFDISDEYGLPQYGLFPTAGYLSFPKLGYVFRNGDMWFTGINWDVPHDSSLYKISTGEIIQNKEIKALYKRQNNKKILLNGRWQDIIYDRRATAYFVGEEKIVDLKYIPLHLRGSTIFAPIGSDLSFWISNTTMELVNNNFGRDYIFFIYSLKDKKVLNEIVLPLTTEYLTFDFGIGERDSQDRVFFRFWTNKERQYEGMTHGHIMIYDIRKDTMYNIRHPFFDENNKSEELLETQYILGEDENIYYQLVTDKAYYVYKIEPLWNEPMEETGYEPVFFEMHPDLKKEWDKMSNK